MNEVNEPKAQLEAVPLDCKVMPSNLDALMVEFFYQAGDDPFVCGVTGHVTTEALFKIEAEAKQESESLFDKGDGSYLFEATWFSGQYGEYGQCELPPGWDLEWVAFEEADLGHNASFSGGPPGPSAASDS